MVMMVQLVNSALSSSLSLVVMFVKEGCGASLSRGRASSGEIDHDAPCLCVRLLCCALSESRAKKIGYDF